MDRFITRREFVNYGMALAGMAGTVPTFLLNTANVLAGDDPIPSTRKQRDHRILVIIQLAGGNDGLNTVIPYSNDTYYKLRPKLAIEKDKTLKIDREFGLHPSATGLKSLFDDGLLALVRGVGYPNPDRSHFRSTDIWQTASPGGALHDGWLGRYFDCECKGKDSVDPMLGMALVDEAPLALRGEKFLPVAFDSPHRLSLKGIKGPKVATEVIAELNRPEAGAAAEPRTTLDYLRRTALDAQLSAQTIRTAAESKSTRVEFPKSGLAQSLQTIHRLIVGGLPTRVYYASLPGFDTHAQQSVRHANLLGELGGALEAFVRALRESGDLDRVVFMTFSEFGRRVAENASGGTDHGAAAPMILGGGKIKPGFHGPIPSLERLADGDLSHTVDFREVYASILKDWFKADVRKILGSTFKTLPLVQA